MASEARSWISQLDISETQKLTLERHLQDIDRALVDSLGSAETYPALWMREEMAYALEGAGKRVRPLLLLSVADMLGAKRDEPILLDFALALEYIHNYSLVHDDLPAMDNDEWRRGRLTLHRAYGEADAILTGDALLNEAVLLTLRHIDQVPEQQHLSWAKACKTLFEASGARGMIAGQCLDLRAAESKAGQQQLETIERLKTACLMEAACLIPAHYLGQSDLCCRALQNFARSLGLAFQIQDDILDAEAGEKEEGRNFVTLLGLAGAKKRFQDEADKIQQSLQQLQDMGFDTAVLLALWRALAQRAY